LIQQALSGRQSSYGILVRRYEQYVFALALRFVKNREDAHEVAQDSFLRCFRYLSDFRGDCKFSTWLYKIVYSTALNALRKHQPDIQSLDDEARPVKAVANAVVPDISIQMERADRSATLQKAIAQLSQEDATVISLFYLYEQSLDEICEITGMTLSNAKTRLSRARQRLKVIINEQFEGQIV
jgi:RNA polymerase sigma factor (sigma-70 family)